MIGDSSERFTGDTRPPLDNNTVRELKKAGKIR